MSDRPALSRVICISEKKYCSVEVILKHSAVITTTLEVANEAAVQAETPANCGDAKGLMTIIDWSLSALFVSRRASTIS